MARSKLASYETGYEDERFEHVVSESFHCIICSNVFKDPVMCRPHDGHLFCRACITRHLMKSQTCPTCMQPLTVETLTEASRNTRNLLDELRISCEFFHRGCRNMVELGELERHVKGCGFAPAVCSNEGCNLEMNKQDLVHHKTAVCEKRNSACHSCINEIRQEIDEKEKKIEDKLERNEERLKAVEQNLVIKVELVQEQLKQEINNLHVPEDIVDIKKSLHEITKQLERMTLQKSHKDQAEQEEIKKEIVEADYLDTDPKIVVAAGKNVSGILNSVEMFSLSTRTWTQLQPMSECRSEASSFVYNNQVVVTGGYGENGPMKSMERLSANTVHARNFMSWEKLTAELFGRFFGHCCVVYNEQLIVIGGLDGDNYETSDGISDVSLVPPYATKLLAIMPKGRYYHGVACFDDKILIVGGKEALLSSTLNSVVMYDVTKNECQELAPLPYSVSGMATVKWGDDNIIIIGGDSEGETSNKVLIYNINTHKCHMLPDMKYNRKACVAAVVKRTVIVMGGQDDRGKCLTSVECFRFDRYSWEELPDMHKARSFATAVVC